jgi:hypothetical protein
MTIRQLEIAQWFGVMAGGTIWFTEFIVGVGASEAVCNPASSKWGIPHDLLQISLLAFAALLVACAEGAAVLVFLSTRDAEEQGPPPHARMRFFAIGAMAGNLVFLMIILLTGIATIADPLCHQA